MAVIAQQSAAPGPSRPSQPEHPQLEYYFTVANMYSTEREDDPRGDWQISRTRRTNRKVTGPDHSWIFRFDGRTTTRIHSLPQELVIHNTSSLYHADGRIWTVDYDATEYDVGGGDHSEVATAGFEDEDGPYRDEWVKLSFNHVEGNATYLSYVGRHQERKRLLMQRLDQLWATQLFPDAFQATRPADYTDNQEYGGLVGNLSLLIGLVAMSLPATEVPHHLPGIIVHGPGEPRGWRVAAMPRRVGWSERRGLVVKVLHNENKSPARLLTAYENGAFGKILS